MSMMSLRLIRARVVHWATPRGLRAYRQAPEGSMLQHGGCYVDCVSLLAKGPSVSQRLLSTTSASTPLIDATIADVCEWAGRELGEQGAGLSDANVDILRRHEINGGSLLSLTDAELHSVGMPLGARKDLLTAVALLKGFPGAQLGCNKLSVGVVNTPFCLVLQSTPACRVQLADLRNLVVPKRI